MGLRGRVGASLARALERRGHEVAVIDQDELSFRRLGSGFEASGCSGSVSIETPCARRGSGTPTPSPPSPAVTTPTSSPRVAREKFGVENVVARIYDPGRAEIYQRLGIPTVATVKWTSDQVLRRLLPQGHVPEFTDPRARSCWPRSPLAGGVDRSPGGRDRGGLRAGSPMCPDSGRLHPRCPRRSYQAGDFVHLRPRTRRPRRRRARPRRGSPDPPTTRKDAMRVVIAGAGASVAPSPENSSATVTPCRSSTARPTPIA